MSNYETSITVGLRQAKAVSGVRKHNYNQLCGNILFMIERFIESELYRDFDSDDSTDKEIIETLNKIFGE